MNLTDTTFGRTILAENCETGAVAASANLEQLRRIELFDRLADDKLAFVAAHSVLHSYAGGSQVLSHHDKSNDVFFILGGRLQVKNYSRSGREFIYSEIGAGQLFGEFSAIDGLPRSAAVEAIDDSLVAHMKAADFLALLKSDFDLTLRLLRLLTAKSRGLSDRMFELIALTARDRLCGELARLAAEGTKEGTSILIRPAPTHYEFAARIGSHREAVTRELNQLAARGLLRLGRRHIVILDAARFRREMLGGDHEA
jgi:CRP-like cAMP-binding protein